MLKNINKTNLYYISVILLSLKIFYSTSQIFTIPNILSKVITLIIIILLLAKIYLEKYTLKQWKYILPIILLTGYTSIRINEYNIILTTLLAIGIKDVDLKKILKIIVSLNLLILALHIITYLIYLYINPDFVLFYYAENRNCETQFYVRTSKLCFIDYYINIFSLHIFNIW